ncbi:hypothetical protein ID875_21285 [Streptomyces globisporus]|uniref:RanBP2-type domain-containing protein n=1 Tax=Streptomyces globisporus TaxID=1908 RepID=A0A927BNK5_STRGL|nr:hypothetical protein [Streptomyces globisporus]
MYDACHDCQRPSWTCASCGTVNATAWSHCQECDSAIPAEALGDREEGFEMTWEEHTALMVGPRASVAATTTGTPTASTRSSPSTAARARAGRRGRSP